MTLVYFFIALGLLIFVHELGHFLAAKKQGIGVEKFSLGFGPRLLSFKRGETTYLLSLLPFGGYVKLKGEESESADQGDPRSYSGRGVGERFAVVFSGPFMNLLLALLLMPLVFMVGRPEPAFWQEEPVVTEVQRDSPAEKGGLSPGDRLLTIDGKEVHEWKGLLSEVILQSGKTVRLTFQRGGEVLTREVVIAEDPQTKGGLLGVEPLLFLGNEAVIDAILPEGPAERAGLREGDTILRINGQVVENWTEMSQKIQESGGHPLKVDLRRAGGPEGSSLSVLIEPRLDESSGRYVIGIQKDYGKRGLPLVERRYPFSEAVTLGVKENLKWGGLTLSVVWRLVTLQLSYKTLGGPIRIAQASAAAAETGLTNFIYFLAFLSLQLGVLNLLPIPVLDGGHLFFFLLEAIRRRPVSLKARLVAEQAGFVLLVTLMVFVTLHDVDSIWGFQKIFDKMKGLF